MHVNTWSTERWPQGVPRDIGGYHKPYFSILDDAASEYPQAVFTIFSGADRTYAQVREAANRVANFLMERGIRKGDRVAMFLPNLAHYPIVYFGIMKTGAVCVTCNPLYNANELNYQLKDAGAKALFCMDHPQFYPVTVEAIQGSDVETVVICSVKSILPPVKAFIGGLLGKIPKAGNYAAGHLFFDDVVKQASPEAPSVDI
nr:AMP-binding protein [Desulfobacterales bacterium]